MVSKDTYPVPIEQERLAMAMGFFIPAATPTDAQRMEAAQMVEGRVEFKRSAYWMHLEKIIERDTPNPQKRPTSWLKWLDRHSRPRQGRKPTRGAKTSRHRWHCDTSRDIIPIY